MIRQNKSSYDFYIRARYFAERIDKLNIFVSEATKYISRKKDYFSSSLLISVLSYEGFMEKLKDFIVGLTDYSKYNYLKYGARAFIYRALKDEKVEFNNLKEFMKAIEDEDIEGIIDLKRLQEDSSKKEFYLRTAVNFLKEMVDFHIGAAKRTRYERAAYYCSVIKDILTILKQPEEFNTYYDNLINVNRRRPALKDEMKMRIGR